ncbi:MAG: prepilin-type N-terminal cleavage/methylation domain-containing protein [Lentisphaerae bacterium]|nr:prepilin-type N-terminal cleavage/methylation domain-containing protein [Lentisphaerota bacterium]
MSVPVGRRWGCMRSCDAFSLIEVLVATVIFVMIILAMSTLFHQSNVAWDGGTRKVRGNSMARGALTFMSRELLTAVAKEDLAAGSPLGCWIASGDSANIVFVTLGQETDGTNRTVRRIEYYQNGDQIKRTEEKCVYSGTPYGSYYSLGDAVLAEDLVDSPDGLVFTTPPRPGGGDYTNDLPNWIKIRLALKRFEDVSGIGARSAGPDGAWDNEDDISSW